MIFNSSAHAYVEALKKRGYSILGQGHFSTVLIKMGSDRVIKVSGTGYGKTSDDGWPAYVSFLRQNPSKHAPQIYNFKRHQEGTDQSFYVAVMELLDNTVGEVKSGPGRKDEVVASYRYANAVLFDNTTKHRDEDHELRDFMVKIRHAFKGIYDFDLHDANAMVRYDDTLVIVDPLSFPT